MDRIAFAFELKSADDAGSFEGYASVFGNKDQGGDIVERGAFAKSIKSRGIKGVKMLADHDPKQRVGIWEEMREDERGLYVRGRLLTEKSNGKDAYVDLKSGALDGLSIGGRTLSDAIDGRKRARVIKEFDLYEISLVSFPMNEQARVVSVKSLIDLSHQDCREIERKFIETGLSRADAVKALSGLKNWLQRDAGAPGTLPRDEDSADLAKVIRQNIALISS